MLKLQTTMRLELEFKDKSYPEIDDGLLVYTDGAWYVTSSNNIYKSLTPRELPTGVLDKREYGYRAFTSLSNISDWVILPTTNISMQDKFLSKRLEQILSCFDCSEIVEAMLLKNRLPRDKKIRNLDIRPNDNTVSFLPENKQCILSENGKWSRKNRQASKPGKLIKKIFGNQFSQREIEVFQNKLKAHNATPTIVEVSGEDIRKYYHENTHLHSDLGTLGNSCMRHENCQEFFDIYVKNPEISMLVIKKEGKVIGRALLWKYNDVRIMDRAYGSESTQQQLINYAKEKGYWYKESQSMGYTAFIINGEAVHEDVFIKLKYTEFDTYPYMDTFRYLCYNGVSNKSHHDHFGEADQTRGYLEDNMISCEECGDSIHEDDMYSVGGYCYCENCTCYDEIDGETILGCDAVCLNDERYTHEDNAVEAYDDDGRSIMVWHEDAFYCEWSDKDYSSDHCTSMYIEELGVTINEIHEDDCMRDNGYVRYNGEWCKKDEIIKELYDECMADDMSLIEACEHISIMIE